MGTILSFFLSDILFLLSSPSLADFYSKISGGLGLSQIGGLWFLWSVLAGSLVVGAVFHLTKKPFLRILLLLLGIFIVAFFPNGQNNIYMYPYFVAGFLFAMCPEGKAKNILIKLRYISVAAFPCLLFFYKKEHFIYVSGIHLFDKFEGINGVKTDSFRWLIGFVGSIFAITVIKFIFDIFYNRFNGKKIHFFQTLGKKIIANICFAGAGNIPLDGGYLQQNMRSVRCKFSDKMYAAL